MRLSTVFAILAPPVALSLVSTVLADKLPHRHTNSILPTLTLAGSSGGKAELSSGLSVLVKLTDELDLNLAPAFTLMTNNGIGQLFNVSGDNISMGSPWNLGLTASLLWLDTRRTPEEKYLSEKLGAAQTCIKKYTEQINAYDEPIKTYDGQLKDLQAHLDALEKLPKGTANSAGAKAILQAQINNLQQQKSTIEGKQKSVAKELRDLNKMIQDYGAPAPDTLCAEGLEEYSRLLKLNPVYLPPRERLSAVPKLAIAAGFNVGQVSFRYLEGMADAPMALQDAKSSQVLYSVAASLTYIYSRRGITFELPLSYSSAWDASPTKAQVCTTAGLVGTEPARVCNDRIVGAPTSTGTLVLSPQLGYVDIRTLFWRVAAGPYLAYQSAGVGQGQIELGVKTPAYLNFVAGIPGYKGEYHGMLRLTPAVSWVKNATGWQDVKFMIEAAVLGNRSMFPRALEWL